MKVIIWIERNLGAALFASGLLVAFFVATSYAQQGAAPTPKQAAPAPKPAAPAQKPAAAGTGTMTYTATSANVSQSGTPVRINILRWSSDEERNTLITAFTMPVQAAPPAENAGGGRGGRGGGGGGAGGRGARGGAAAAGGDTAATPAAGDAAAPAAAGDAAAGRGGAAAGGGRGGRGGGGGRGGARGDAPAAPPAPADPISSLTAALGRAPTVGYIWTNEAVGYSLKYAYRMPSPDGSERIVLVTDRRLGGYTTAWKPAAASSAPEYDFSIVELRLNSKGLGEGKSSLTTKVMFDADAKTLALENYAAAPSVLQNVKR